jgi:single-strand DNA-binding protein
MEPTMHLQGNLVADPSYRVTANGLHMAKFRIASSGRRFDKQAEGWVNTDPVYMSVVCWRQLADNVAKSLRKGDTVIVHGRLTYREYDDNDGKRRSSYEVDAFAVGPDLSRYSTELIRPLRDLVPTATSGDGSGAEGSTIPEQAANPWDEAVPAAAEPAA